MSYMTDLELRFGSTRGPNERRDRDRVPLQLLLNEYVGDQMHRAMTTNVSPTGLYLDRIFGQGLDRLQLGREDRQVQLEFTLPETTEVIWALGEIRHDDVGVAREQMMVHGTGVRFTAMARKHERMIHDFVFEQRRRGLEQLLERIRNRRRRDRRVATRRAA
jgi:hypothetical protein